MTCKIYTQISVPINKVLLRHRHIHSFIDYVYFHTTMAELSSNHMACKAQNSYCFALDRKYLPTPCLILYFPVRTSLHQ